MFVSVVEANCPRYLRMGSGRRGGTILANSIQFERAADHVRSNPLTRGYRGNNIECTFKAELDSRGLTGRTNAAKIR